MLKFGPETTAILERAYLGGDFRDRRRASFAALAPAAGDHVADIGCGNGMMTVDLALAVGDQGKVTGIDPSAEMLALAGDRVKDLGNVTLSPGSAEGLPLEDASVDKAVSLQVFEYLDDPAAGLVEILRVLAPGGRVVIGDMHFGTLAWFSEDPDRMVRMCDSWNRHVADPALPARLPALLEEAGFEVEGVSAHTNVDTALRPDGLARMMMILMENYAVSNGHLPADEARAWADEQVRLAADGRFFQTLTHFVVSGRKPPDP